MLGGVMHALGRDGQVLAVDADQLGAPECLGKAQQNGGAVAQVGQAGGGAGGQEPPDLGRGGLAGVPGRRRIPRKVWWIAGCLASQRWPARRQAWPVAQSRRRRAEPPTSGASPLAWHQRVKSSPVGAVAAQGLRDQHMAGVVRGRALSGRRGRAEGGPGRPPQRERADAP